MIMLGSSCSSCCASTPCDQCEEGTALPATVTVTFAGLSGVLNALNGQSIAIARSTSNPCVYVVDNCLLRVAVSYEGPASPPSVSLYTQLGGVTEITLSPEDAYPCDDLEFTTLEDGNGVSAAVSPGGTPSSLPLAIPDQVTATWTCETLDMDEALSLAGNGPGGNECNQPYGGDFSYTLIRNARTEIPENACVTTPGFGEYSPEPGVTNPPYVVNAGTNAASCDAATRNPQVWSAEEYWREDLQEVFANVHFDCNNTLHEAYLRTFAKLRCLESVIEDAFFVEFSCPGIGGGAIFLRPPYAGPGACPDKEWAGPSHSVEFYKGADILSFDPFEAVSFITVTHPVTFDQHDIVVTITE